MRTVAKAIVVLAAMTVLVAGALWRSAPPAPERIVLIVVDTLRQDYLSCYGGPVATPNLDRLASRGQLFRDAVSSFHQTSMSMGAMFTRKTPSIAASDGGVLDWNSRTW